MAGSPVQPGPAHGPAPDAAAVERHARKPTVRHPVLVQQVIPRPVDDVWAAVLDAGTFTLYASPAERAGVVPGTPVARVGELRCLVVPINEMPSVMFFEVVALGPGHRLVLRHHSLSHPTQSITTVTPHPTGALVTCSHEVLVHPGETLRGVGVTRQAWAAYLERLAGELAPRVPPPPAPPAPPAPAAPAGSAGSAGSSVPTDGGGPGQCGVTSHRPRPSAARTAHATTTESPSSASTETVTGTAVRQTLSDGSVEG
jgi:uncharacterized protein YndB with AHSA1/START domain